MAIPEKNNPEYGKNKDLVFVRYKPIAEEYYKAHDLKPSKKNPLTAEQYQEIQDIFAKEINRLAGEGYRLANMGYPDSLVAMFVR